MHQTTTHHRFSPEAQAALGAEFRTPPTLPLKRDAPPASPLDELVRNGARQMLQSALEAEVQSFIEQHATVRDARGHRQIVRNGYLPEREIITGAGPLPVEQPRVRDKRKGLATEERLTFTSSLLPTYLRRSKSIDELIPWLYLKGVSTGNFTEALQSLVGEEARGLSASVVTRLMEQWQDDYIAWQKRDLTGQRYVYMWVDGIHVNVRLSGEKQCFLVVMGATADGTKELVAVQEGIREDKQSWYELLIDLKSRGLQHAPLLVIGDGALGFWAAVREVWPEVREQRCWVHKTANVLSKMPKHLHSQAKDDLHQIWMAASKEEAEKAFNTFVEKYSPKYPAATECLQKDRDELLTFYDFPAEHWVHLRTTNPIESAFATIRLRHRRTKGNGSAKACRAMILKLAQSAQRNWRKLNGQDKIILILQGKKFKDGVQTNAA